MRKSTYTKRSRDSWRELLRDYEQSGLTQDQFCKLNNLAPSTFAKWKKQIREARPPVNQPDFIEIPVHDHSNLSASSEPRLQLSVSLANRIRLDFQIS